MRKIPSFLYRSSAISAPRPPMLGKLHQRSYSACQHDWIACHQCGQIQRSAVCGRDKALVCSRCNHTLSFGQGPWRETSAALAVTGLVLFVVSNCFVFLGLEVGAFYQESTLLSGVWALFANDQLALATLVLVTIFLFPLFELLALCYLVLPCYLNIRLPGQITIFRWFTKASPWSMLEIFLLGVLVTSVKLGDMASIILGISMVSFFVLVAVLGASYWFIDKDDLWAWLQPNNCYVHSVGERLYDCEICHALVGEKIVVQQGYCPRCDNRIYLRKPNSLQKTFAYTLAAALLYIPANLLPIMAMTSITGNREDTIYSGIVSLAAHGLWGIAAVVFIASLVVPMAKLFIMLYLVWSVWRADIRAMRERMWMFRVTEWVGRWSMVDVFVVTLLTGLVHFGFLGEIKPGAALLPFASVVVLTMLGAHAFDPRLIWDAKDAQEQEFTAAMFVSKVKSVQSDAQRY
ncbi:MAG: paraquat-inducible protein A [Marinagarivorans sp.]|nr:paraquat-inducible protein A [Marinagarivorans sp.]